MPSPVIVVTPAHLTAIRDHARRAYPDECCGLLIGRADAVATEPGSAVRVTRVVESPNVAPEPSRRFEIDPALRFRLMRDLRTASDASDTADSIVGHYHSHPDGPAEPSATDRAQAYEPDLIWLIVSVKQDEPGAIAAFRLLTDPAQEDSGNTAPYILRVPLRTFG